MIGILRTVNGKKLFDVCNNLKDYATNKRTCSISFFSAETSSGDIVSISCDAKLNEVQSNIDGYWNECELYKSPKKIEKLIKKYNNVNKSDIDKSPINKLLNYFKG